MEKENKILKDKVVSYDLAVKLKEKGFPQEDVEILHFYTKPRSKMYGIDEHGRLYPITNKSKQLYTIGSECSNDYKNAFTAPTMSLSVRWLREQHNIYIEPRPCNRDINGDLSKADYFEMNVISKGSTPYTAVDDDYDMAMSDALMHALDLI